MAFVYTPNERGTFIRPDQGGLDTDPLVKTVQSGTIVVAQKVA